MKTITLLLLTLIGCTNIRAQKPIVLGSTVELTSAILAEKRKLNIYLPEGYNKADTTRYPVIYLLDGGTDEDFIHTVGLVQFCTFPWVATLPNSIVVGIANTNRKRDMTFPATTLSYKQVIPASGGSENFIAYIERELQPYIQKHYKTNSDRMLIGQSLAGLLAAEVIIKKPGLFNRYVIISPSLWWDDGSLLKLNPATPPVPTNIYVAVGKEGLTPGEKPHVMEVDANLLAEKLKTGANKNTRVYFDYLPAENHATIGHQALMNGFGVIYTTTGNHNK